MQGYFMEPDKDSSPAEQSNNVSGAPEQDISVSTESTEPTVDNTLATDDMQSEGISSEPEPASPSTDLNAPESSDDVGQPSGAPMSDVTPPQTSLVTTAEPEPAATTEPKAPQSTLVSSEGPETQSQIVTGGADSPVSTAVVSPPSEMSADSPKPRRHLKWVIAAVIVLVVVLAGGYTFAFYLPNTPSNVYKSGLTNTGKAADKLVAYMQQEQSKAYKSVSFDGKIDVKSGTGSGDATLSGAFDKSGNGTLDAKVDIAGEHIQLNGRSVVAKGNTSPDLYLQVTGVKKFLDGFGMSSLDSLDGQWISVDHTLVDTYKKDFTQGFAEGFANGSGGANGQLPTPSEMTGTIADVQTVNKQYIFTTDSSKVVLTNQKFIGKETKDSRSVDHYKVGYNKAHLQAYVAALKTTLDASPLNGWSRKANNGKSMSEFMNWSDLEKSVKNAKSDYTFDVWVDTKTKLISSVEFTDPSDSSSKFIIGQSYTGGSSYPLNLSFSGKDDSGAFGTMTMNMAVDTSTHKYTGSFSVSVKGTDAVDLDGTFTLIPNTNSVNVTAPKNATSINDVIAQLGFGGSSATSTSEGFDSTSALLL